MLVLLSLVAYLSLFFNIGDGSGAHGATAFTNRKP